MTRVLMAAEIIAPGGGPAGYTYNLMQGFQSPDAARGLQLSWEGTPETGRYRGLGEGSGSSRLGALARRVRDNLPVPILYRLFNALRWRVGAANRRRRSAYRAADVVVFQGYQPSARAVWARRASRSIVYMPHSPSVIADEIRMLEEARVGRIARARYRFLKWDERRLFAISDLVVFASPGAAEQYDSAYPELASAPRRFVLSGAARPSIHLDSPAVDDGAVPTVLFAGRYVGHKGYDLFIEAAELASAEGVSAHFKTLGTGPEVRASAAVEDLGWSERPHDEMMRAAVIVVPNRIAYFDLLPLEAAALGKPLVLTRVGGNVDQLRELPASVGAEPRADSVVHAVKEALDRVRSDPEFGVENARSYSLTFTPERMAERWGDLLRELASRPPRH